MAVQWARHDDSTYMATLGGVLMVAVVYDKMGSPGWKIHVGNRALRDKLSSMEDAQKVALAFANRILNQCRKDLDELMAENADKESS